MKKSMGIGSFESSNEREAWDRVLDLRLRQGLDANSSIADADAVVLAMRARKQKA